MPCGRNGSSASQPVQPRAELRLVWFVVLRGSCGVVGLLFPGGEVGGSAVGLRVRSCLLFGGARGGALDVVCCCAAGQIRLGFFRWWGGLLR
jgi:hypothetical protein